MKTNPIGRWIEGRRNLKIQKEAAKASDRLTMDEIRSSLENLNRKMSSLEERLQWCCGRIEAIGEDQESFQDNVEGEIKDLQRGVEVLNNMLEDVDTHNLVTGDNFNEFLESGLDSATISITF